MITGSGPASGAGFKRAPRRRPPGRAPWSSPSRRTTSPRLTVATQPSLRWMKRLAPPGRSCTISGRADAGRVEVDEVHVAEHARLSVPRSVSPNSERCRGSSSGRPTPPAAGRGPGRAPSGPACTSACSRRTWSRSARRRRRGPTRFVGCSSISRTASRLKSRVVEQRPQAAAPRRLGPQELVEHLERGAARRRGPGRRQAGDRPARSWARRPSGRPARGRGTGRASDRPSPPPRPAAAPAARGRAMRARSFGDRQRGRSPTTTGSRRTGGRSAGRAAGSRAGRRPAGGPAPSAAACAQVEHAPPRHRVVVVLGEGELDRPADGRSRACASRPSPARARPGPRPARRPAPARTCPCRSSPRTRPMPNSSSSAANVPGTGSPSMAMWAIVRDVEKPSAPALHRRRGRWRAMASMSSSVAGSFLAPRSPIT